MGLEVRGQRSTQHNLPLIHCIVHACVTVLHGLEVRGQRSTQHNLPLIHCIVHACVTVLHGFRGQRSEIYTAQPALDTLYCACLCYCPPWVRGQRSTQHNLPLIHCIVHACVTVLHGFRGQRSEIYTAQPALDTLYCACLCYCPPWVRGQRSTQHNLPLIHCIVHACVTVLHGFRGQRSEIYTAQPALDTLYCACLCYCPPWVRGQRSEIYTAQPALDTLYCACLCYCPPWVRGQRSEIYTAQPALDTLYCACLCY